MGQDQPAWSALFLSLASTGVSGNARMLLAATEVGSTTSTEVVGLAGDAAATAPWVVMKIPTPKEAGEVALSPDGEWVAFGTPANAIVVQATNASKVPPASLQRLPAKFLARYLAFHPKRNWLAVGGKKLVQVFDLNTGTVRSELSHPATVAGLDWHPKGEILGTSCDDLKIRLWDVAAATLAQQPLTGHTAVGIDLRFSHTGSFLTSGDWSKFLRLWDIRTGRQVLAVPGLPQEFSGDDRKLAVAAGDNQLQMWKFAPTLARLSQLLFAGRNQTCSAGRRKPTHLCLGSARPARDPSAGPEPLDWDASAYLLPVPPPPKNIQVTIDPGD